MLAFTVQFSRYGRNPGPPDASASRELRAVTSTLILHSPEEISLPGAAKLEYSASQRHAAASSGPNSVLISQAFVRSFRGPRRGPRTSRAFARQLDE